MDGVAALLDGPRAHGAFLLRSMLDPPWSLRIEDRAPLAVVALVRGEAWLEPDDAEPIALTPGDVAIIRGPEPYTVADRPGRPPQVVVHPGGGCEAIAGAGPSAPSMLGARTWGTSRDGATVMLTGAYQLDGEVSRRLLRALPQRIVLRDAHCPIIPLLADEIDRDHPGQEAVLDRLLDLLLVAALRDWLARPEAQAPGWYRAYADPEVGRALRLLHAEPARAWTVASLAREVGVSRASLARRFAALVGEPPMAFLAELRIALAADLLHE
ncbi:MAG TPA: AraC family transcriptional regulator, partial [Capillimicrobium sp.]